MATTQDGNRLNQAFRRVDTNEDGKLSQDEIDRFALLKNRLQAADKDGDGSVSVTEFRQEIANRDARPAGILSAEDGLRTVTVGQRERQYQVHVPKSYDPSKATPVVIAMTRKRRDAQALHVIRQAMLRVDILIESWLT